MGVPGFFAWILKKYNNNKIITQNLNQPVDILYIDANCLFHPQCYKVLNFYNNNQTTDFLEQQMMDRILNYIDYLIEIVNPQQSVYIAVDGVAPLSKLNQQRKRRFRTVQDNVLINDIKQKHGKEIKNKWNNTCITPGTQFMEKLHIQIINHIKKNKKKFNIDYVYSSYHTPGEGEHKILQDIRCRQSKVDDSKQSKVNDSKQSKVNDSKHNNTYVIYGLDADLIFLSMASQQDNIFLLREDTEFNNKINVGVKVVNDIVSDVEENLKFVSIDETKKYINDTFQQMINKKLNIMDDMAELYTDLQNGKTVDNIVDYSNDFIYLCYFIGNDFLPALPSIDIKNGGLDLLINIYTDIYIDLQTTIITFDKKVDINNIFIEMLFKNISKYEDYYFKVKMPKYLEMISGRKCLSDDPYDNDMWNLENMRAFKTNDPIKLGYDEPSLWKHRYYQYYYGVTGNQTELINHICEEYLKGTMWITQYYFDRCLSWTWQYIYSHPPFVSDLANYIISKKIDMNNYNFKETKPLTPFVQLLSVLPPVSNNLLPSSYQKLVTSKDSPIIDLYPTKVAIDMLYKDTYHKCVPLIPIIDIDRITNAINQIDNKISKTLINNDEIIRNKYLDEIIIRHKNK